MGVAAAGAASGPSSAPRSRATSAFTAGIGLLGHGFQYEQACSAVHVPVSFRKRLPAQLAGVSMAYYTRLEQGHVQDASLEILDAIARVLQLSEAERLHLTHLAGPKSARRRIWLGCASRPCSS